MSSRKSDTRRIARGPLAGDIIKELFNNLEVTGGRYPSVQARADRPLVADYGRRLGYWTDSFVMTFKTVIGTADKLETAT